MYFVVFQEHLRCIPCFSPDILIKPREEISFLVSTDQIDFMYNFVWNRLFNSISHNAELSSRLNRITKPDVISQRYLPQSRDQILKRSSDFNSIAQGSSTISAFTQKLLDEGDVLRFLGVSKSDDEITWALHNGLNHGEARNYAFTNQHISLDAFVEMLNIYDSYNVAQIQKPSAYLVQSQSLAFNAITVMISDIIEMHALILIFHRKNFLLPRTSARFSWFYSSVSWTYRSSIL